MRLNPVRGCKTTLGRHCTSSSDNKRIEREKFAYEACGDDRNQRNHDHLDDTDVVLSLIHI
eukprot:3603885-Rhodomonas_salina.1